MAAAVGSRAWVAGASAVTASLGRSRPAAGGLAGGRVRRRSAAMPAAARAGVVDHAGLGTVDGVRRGVRRALDRDAGAGGDGADRRNDRGLAGKREAARRPRRRCSTARRARNRAAAAHLRQRGDHRERDDGAARVANSDTGAVDRVAHGAGCGADRVGDLIVGVTLEGTANQGLALLGRQGGDGRDRAVELVVGEHDVAGLGTPSIRSVNGSWAAVALRVERPVTDDRVEPGLQVHLPVSIHAVPSQERVRLSCTTSSGSGGPKAAAKATSGWR